MRALLALSACLLCFGIPGLAQNLPPPLTFHAALNGTLTAEALGNGTPVKVDGPVAYRPGRTGQALLCGEGGAAVWYASAGNLRSSAGTVEMWVCPLDWTGKEDEFHVFLEALDPGWLVFYRYYQGGILTLTGTDNAHYTAAASQPIEWKPGEWHHLAGTWRARRLEVYIDGQRAGVAEAALLSEKPADAFRVGDHPWHVARQRQTLLQGLKIYSAPLDAESIANAAKGLPIAWKPQMLLDSTVDPDTDTLKATCDATGLLGEQGAGRSVRLTLVPKGQAEPVAQAEITAFTNDLGQAELALDILPPGTYELRAVLLSAAGAEVASCARPFTKPGPPVWSGNALGRTDTIPPPWVPLQTDSASASVESWDRRYTYGTLLAQVRSGATDLLSQPVTLEALINGTPVALSGPACRLEQASAGKATLSGQAEGAGLRLTVRHQVEYDGFTWTDLSVQATPPVSVDELRLTWRLPRRQATLMHADRLAWANNPAGALPAAGWTSPLIPCFWLGNEERGLSWYVESSRNWRPNPDQPAIQVRPEGDQVAVTIRLLAERTTVGSALEYGFGMLATPTRPYPPDSRSWRMVPGVRATFDIIWPNGNFKYYGYTEAEDPARFAEKVKSDHAQDCRVVPYINLNFASAGIPEWQYCGSRWADAARVVTPSDVAAMGFPSMGTCPNRRDWQDFILFRINEMIDRYQVDGIYVDCWGPVGCQCPSCGWVDASGKRQATYPVRAYRELMRRAYVLLRERCPRALLMSHMSSEIDDPILTFADAVLDGEQFVPGKVRNDYLELLPPEMFRAEFLGRNHGPVEFFLPEFRPEYTVEDTATLAAYLRLHDVSVWPIWSHTETWNRLFEAEDAFGLAAAAFRPYWQSPPTQVLVSSYSGKAGAMLAVLNTGEATEAALTLDVASLGMRSVGSAVDVLRGSALTVQGNALSVPLARHQGRVIRLTP